MKDQLNSLTNVIHGEIWNFPLLSQPFYLGNNDQLFYYNRDLNQALKNNQVFRTSYDELNGIGNIIRQRQNELKKRNIDQKDMVVLIKPGSGSSYKNVINALDEMLINGVSRYVITDLKNEEIILLEQSNHNH